jgi:hypothetical protein
MLTVEESFDGFEALSADGFDAGDAIIQDLGRLKDLFGHPQVRCLNFRLSKNTLTKFALERKPNARSVA